MGSKKKTMGKERDKLIRSLGGKPVSELNLSDEEIMKLAWNTYWEKGEIPPLIAKYFDEDELAEMRKRLKKKIEKKRSKVLNNWEIMNP